MSWTVNDSGDETIYRGSPRTVAFHIFNRDLELSTSRVHFFWRQELSEDLAIRIANPVLLAGVAATEHGFALSYTVGDTDGGLLALISPEGDVVVRELDMPADVAPLPGGNFLLVGYEKTGHRELRTIVYMVAGPDGATLVEPTRVPGLDPARCDDLSIATQGTSASVVAREFRNLEAVKSTSVSYEFVIRAAFFEPLVVSSD